jgi:effector-binding domain-containing protein
MIDTPQVIRSPARSAAVIHITVPRDDIRSAMGTGHRELMAALAAQGIAPAGPWFTHHLRAPAETFDFEIGVPVASVVAPAGRVKAGELPAATVARTVYHGPYEGLAQGWGELMAWIAAAGYTPASHLWEVYVAGPETGADASGYRTELNRPLVAAKQ